MEELWRQASEMVSQRPVLWLPVLVADLLGFLVSLGNNALVRAAVLSRLQTHSALGGGALHAPVNAAAMEHATIFAFVLTWSSNFIRLLLYATAFVVTAALVGAFRARADKPAIAIGPALRRNVSGIMSLGLRALALYALAAILLHWIGRSLVAHGHKAMLANGWLETGVGVLLVASLALLLAPTAVQVIAHRPLTPLLRQRAQLLALALTVVAFLLGRFVEGNLRVVRIAFVPARYALGLTGSWIAALPYAVLFAGLGLLAWQAEREAGNAVESAIETS